MIKIGQGIKASRCIIKKSRIKTYAVTKSIHKYTTKFNPQVASKCKYEQEILLLLLIFIVDSRCLNL